MKELIGRADLLRTIAAGDLDHGEIAALFGFDHQPRSDRKKSATACGEQSSAPLVVSHESMEEAPHQPMTTGFQPAPIRFWRAQEFMRRSGSERHEEVDEPLLERIAPSASAESSNDQDSSDVRRVPFRPVTSIVDLLTRLRSLTEMTRPGTRPDVAKLISGICRGKTLQEVPREIRRSWGRGLHLIADTSPRLQPYRMDQGVASLVMRDLLPKSHATLATVSGCNLRPFTDWPQESIGRWEPEPGSTVLVLGDLGVLDRRQSGTVDSWVAFGERLRRRQLRMVALVPCHPSRIPDRLQRVWDVLPWDRSTLQVAPLTDEGAAEVIERLFTLLSFAVKVEPHLLRRVRLALPESSSHPELESLIWQHDDLESASSQWITFKRSLRTRLQALRSRESPALLRRVCQMVKAEHSDVYVGIRFSEVINLGDEAKTHFTEDEIAEATEWFEAILAEGEETVELSGSRAAFFRVVATHLGKRVREVLPGLDRIWAHCFEKHQSASPYPEADPAGFDQGLGQVRRIGIVQSRNQLRFQPETGKVETGDSPLAQITSIGDWLRWSDSRDDEELGFQIHRDFWAEGVAPEWASDWGVDEFGLWVELNLPSRDAGAEVPTVTQRLRWIAPGQFLMGSPEDEPGRYDDEGPQHEVTITRGFWMFDTPCTQAFYGAVTGDSPSEFKTPNRPVETVSWEDTQQFFEKLRAVYSAIEIGLPTEAEWEYACRGGTTDALYNGPIELKGINNATALDPIAWYGGNCGVEFDLEDGVNASWGEKQYEFEQGGTRNVGEKGPNPWGLYDMLGNVEEWCEDTWNEGAYLRGDVTDPFQTSVVASAVRVIRGGGWDSDAQYVRAACRVWYSPEGRVNFLGFRCRVRGAEPSREAAEQAELARAGKGGSSQRAGSGWSERSRGDNSPASEVHPTASGPDHHASNQKTTWINLVDRQEASVSLPSASTVKLVSDVEELTLRQFTRPDWARAIGRDEFGLWVDMKVVGPKSGVSAEEIRKSSVRLRWIPPGQFRMGSPTIEPGRWDGEFEPHLVAITEGFWLFETPVTQALWRQVMGTNPSEFKTGKRPVEKVSWDDCQRFSSKLTKSLSEWSVLEVTLPTEAEWEYACRAGTTEATYAGPIEILGDANAPVLDPIGWYGGNSNVDFELENGQDASSWLDDRQHGDKGRKSGTHPVKLKEANRWGLYDMLGNVYEWCSDPAGMPGTFTIPVDETSSSRVIRGGSWHSSARRVRAAYRRWHSPGYRNVDLGFRCRVREL